MVEKSRISFYEQISKNKRDSIILIGVVGAVLTLIVFSISFAFSQLDAFVILFFSILFTLVYTLFSFYNSKKIALASVSAKKASRTTHKQYYDLVEGLTLASGLPMPELYVMDNSQINAFATGRNPKDSAICVTTGTLEKLNKQELEGVLAHELSHIANYDIRFMTLTAVIVGLISMISQIFLRSLWFKGENSNNQNNGKGNAIILIIGLLLAILSPIVTAIVQLAISRRREYSADATAVKFVRSPTGLVGALKKIKSNSEMKVAGSISPLFIAKPNKAKSLFSTHPPIEERIKILEKM